MSREMTGRVAQAMGRFQAAQMWRGGADKPYPPESLVCELAAEMLPLARVAIEAMREPTEAMIDAHTARSRSTLPGCGSHLVSEAKQAWGAMIDAAAREE